MRAAKALLGTAIALIAAASVALAVQVNDYVASPRAISSTSGLTVVRDENDVLVSYPPFEAGLTLTLIGLGLAVLAAALVIGAVVWRRRVSPT